jgi:hypothetical protein
MGKGRVTVKSCRQAGELGTCITGRTSRIVQRELVTYTGVGRWSLLNLPSILKGSGAELRYRNLALEEAVPRG